MIVPDGLVFASAPVLLAASAKAGQWFVQDVISRNKRNNRTNREIDDPPAPTPAPAPAPLGMTIADFEKISDLLKRELNGRYMPAPEARERLTRLEGKVDQLTEYAKGLTEIAPRVIPVPRPSGRGNATAVGEGLVSGGR